MIDTIKLTLEPTDHLPITRNLIDTPVDDWNASYHSNKDRASLVLQNRSDAMRIVTSDGQRTRVEFSIPRLLYSSNAQQVYTDDGLARAWHALSWRLSRLLPGLTPDFNPLVVRLDLSLNLPLDPREVLARHRDLRHPMVRRETEAYYNSLPEHGLSRGRPSRRPFVRETQNTIRLGGTRTVISLYDKVAELRARRSDFRSCDGTALRVEVQLRGASHIAKILQIEGASEVRFNDLTVESCYRAFRRIILQFDPDVNKIPESKPNLVTMLAILQAHPEAWSSIGGVSPVDWYRAKAGVSDRRAKTVARKVAQMEMALSGFRWSDILPEDRLPDLVDIVEHEGELRTVLRSGLPPFR